MRRSNYLILVFDCAERENPMVIMHFSEFDFDNMLKYDVGPPPMHDYLSSPLLTGSTAFLLSDVFYNYSFYSRQHRSLCCVPQKTANLVLTEPQPNTLVTHITYTMFATTVRLNGTYLYDENENKCTYNLITPVSIFKLGDALMWVFLVRNMHYTK